MPRLNNVLDAIEEKKSGRPRGRMQTVGLQVDLSGIDEINDALSIITEQIGTVPVGILERLGDVETKLTSKDVDFSPLQQSIDELKDHVNALVSAVNNIKIEMPQSKPQSFEFDIKRNRGGYIKSIECKPCEPKKE